MEYNGQTLLKARTFLNISQEYVAKKLKLSQKTISNWENNQAGLNKKNFEQYLAVLEISEEIARAIWNLGQIIDKRSKPILIDLSNQINVQEIESKISELKSAINQLHDLKFSILINQNKGFISDISDTI